MRSQSPKLFQFFTHQCEFHTGCFIRQNRFLLVQWRGKDKIPHQKSTRVNGKRKGKRQQSQNSLYKAPNLKQIANIFPLLSIFFLSFLLSVLLSVPPSFFLSFCVSHSLLTSVHPHRHTHIFANCHATHTKLPRWLSTIKQDHSGLWWCDVYCEYIFRPLVPFSIHIFNASVEPHPISQVIRDSDCSNKTGKCVISRAKIKNSFKADFLNREQQWLNICHPWMSGKT